MTIYRTVCGYGSATFLLIAVFLSMAAGAEDITGENIPSGAIDASKGAKGAPMNLKGVKSDKGAVVGPTMNSRLEAGGKGAIVGPAMNTKLEAGGKGAVVGPTMNSRLEAGAKGAVVGPTMNSRVVPGDIDASESLKH